MSVAGLKKQFHKASQLLSEKISGAEGTRLEEDFVEMERKIDVTNKSIVELLSKTIEYLQPNPASRAKLNMLNTVSRIRGQVRTNGYPQAEGLLGDCMLRYGQELGEDSVFGTKFYHPITLSLHKTKCFRFCSLGGALVETGEGLRQMADVKDALDVSVKQNFIDPLQNLQDKELKEITHHLKKLEGRRLDFDYKKKRQGKIPGDEIQQAAEKLEESKALAERSMFNFLESDMEQVSQLASLIEAAKEYHRQSCKILEELFGKLQKRISSASFHPRKEFKPKSIREAMTVFDNSPHDSPSRSASMKSSGPDVQINHTVSIGTSEVLDQPCCRSLYDFEPENEGELGFKEGDVIILTNQIDENWYEGMIHGRAGFLPHQLCGGHGPSAPVKTRTLAVPTLPRDPQDPDFCIKRSTF
ncbi:unnamed protein product [Tetraodon nigroviridis]|uniref:(spotted green pufferfish) hypothetical protein n=1 Tax=Tetraodon nigroviridis TaxID=99883 RepID=Q4T8N7_TETNG|nr:unnamed protein product [Tetraodon nigroviridis]